MARHESERCGGRPAVAWILILLSIFPVVSHPARLDIAPRITIKEILSDNINLVNKDKKDERITQAVPGVSIKGGSGRVDLDLDYSYEYLDYSKNTRPSSDFTNFRGRLRAEAIRKQLFLSANGTIRQRLNNQDRRLLVDNINPANRSDVYTYDAGLSYRGAIGSRALTEIDMDYGVVNFENEQDVADATTQDLTVLVYDKSEDAQAWNLRYGYRGVQRDRDDDVQYITVDAEFDKELRRGLALIVEAGYRNDDVRTLENIRNNGYFTTLGLRWTPTPTWYLDAAYGRNSSRASLRYTPSSRTLVEIRFNDTEIGNNPGSVWRLNATHRARRSEWTLSYEEDSTNSQSLAVIGGRPPLIEVGGTTINANSDIFRFTNEDFIRKSMSMKTALYSMKSTLRISLAREKREFLESGKDERAYGGNANWTWRLSPRSRSVLSGGWVNRTDDVSRIDDTFWFVGASLEKNFTPRASASMEFRHVDRNARQDEGDYVENRLALGARVIF